MFAPSFVMSTHSSCRQYAFALRLVTTVLLACLVGRSHAEVAVSPLTKMRTAHECHQQSSILNIQCQVGHRIRILESFYAVAADQNRNYCQEGFKEKDCKSHSSYQNVCNGRSSCSVNLYKTYLRECSANSNYLTILYECVPENRIHSVCSNIVDFSQWGTLRTTDFPQSRYSATAEDCWCKLSADNNQRIVLSVISFQLFPRDPTCSEAGLYLQSERNRSKECTFLQQGHYYISSNKVLYLNFYSKKPVMRGGFWIIYEAMDAQSKILLKCGDTDEVRPPDHTRFPAPKLVFPPPFSANNRSPNEAAAEASTRSHQQRPFSTKYGATNTYDLSARRKTTAASAARDGPIVYPTSPFGPGYYTLLIPTTSPLNSGHPGKKITTRKRTKASTIGYKGIVSAVHQPDILPKWRQSSRRPALAAQSSAKPRSTQLYSNVSASRLVSGAPYSTYDPFKTTSAPSRLAFPGGFVLYPLGSTAAAAARSTTTSPRTTTTARRTSTTTRTTTTTTRTTTTTTTTSTTTTTTTTTSTTSTRPSTTTPSLQTTTEDVKGIDDVIKTIVRRPITYMETSTVPVMVKIENDSSPDDDEGGRGDSPYTEYPEDGAGGEETGDPDDVPPTSAIPPVEAETSSTPVIESMTTTTVETTTPEKFTIVITPLSSNNNSRQTGVTLTPKTYVLTNTSAIGWKGEEGKKHMQNEPERKLTKTELTIIISCVLFVALLTFINLIIYAMRKLIKKSNKKVNEASLNDQGKKSYDILPGVGEIVLWAAKDKRGYLIDINGSWAKIDGQRWLRENMAVLHNTYKKASMAYRNRFKKKDDKKLPNLTKEDARLIKRAPPTSGTYSLPPVPEAAEYELSDNTSSTSTLHDEIQTATETEYQIEHGRVSGLVSSVHQKKPLFQSAPPAFVGPLVGTDSDNYTLKAKPPPPQLAHNNLISFKYSESGIIAATCDMLTDNTDSNYYLENNEPYAKAEQNYNTSAYNNSNNLEESSIITAKQQQPAGVNSSMDMISSDTDTDSAPIVKRPILIRGDGDFLKNFPSNYGQAESIFSSYSQDNQTTTDLYHAEQSLHQSAHEFFKEIEANKTIQRYKDISNIQQIMEKIEPGAAAGRSDLKKVSCSPGRNTANANSATWYPPDQLQKAATTTSATACAANSTVITHVVNTSTASGSSGKSLNSGVKLDPCILKYSNQPFAIVAPSKSNPNTLEKKKILAGSAPSANNNEESSQMPTIGENYIGAHQSSSHQIVSTDDYETEDYESTSNMLSPSKHKGPGREGGAGGASAGGGQNETIYRSPSSVSSSCSSSASSSESSEDSLSDINLNTTNPYENENKTTHQEAKKLLEARAAEHAGFVKMPNFSANNQRLNKIPNSYKNPMSQRDSGFIEERGEQHSSSTTLNAGFSSSLLFNAPSRTHLNSLEESQTVYSSPQPAASSRPAARHELVDQKRAAQQTHGSITSISTLTAVTLSAAVAQGQGRQVPQRSNTDEMPNKAGHAPLLGQVARRASFFEDSGIERENASESDDRARGGLGANTSSFFEKPTPRPFANLKRVNSTADESAAVAAKNGVVTSPLVMPTTILNNLHSSTSQITSATTISQRITSESGNGEIDEDNRKFRGALQKASQIEEMISRKKPYAPVASPPKSSADRLATSAVSMSSNAGADLSSSQTTSGFGSSYRKEGGTPQNSQISDNVSNSWMRRQKTSPVCDENMRLPPSASTSATSSSHSMGSSPDSSEREQQQHFNNDEFQFFMSAIEKLKATSLFHEEDLKKMTDEQIYEALIEHARKQRRLKEQMQAMGGVNVASFGPSGGHHHHQAAPVGLNKSNNTESIDKEQEEDLPIIMRNLHTVKSLKHYFEIRAKSSSAAAQASGQEALVVHEPESSAAPAEKSRPSIQGMFVKNGHVIERSVQQGVGLAASKMTGDAETTTVKAVAAQVSARVDQPDGTTASSTVEVRALSIETKQESAGDQEAAQSVESSIPMAPVTPVAPPLPDFLTQPSSSQQPIYASKSKYRQKNGSITSTNASVDGNNQSSSHYYHHHHHHRDSITSNQSGANHDLHEKLIKEIHNKSLERSRKDTGISLDERGNLISKPSAPRSGLAVYSNIKNQKVYRPGPPAQPSCNSSIYGSGDYYTINNDNNRALADISMGSVAEKINALTQLSNQAAGPRVSLYAKNHQHFQPPSTTATAASSSEVYTAFESRQANEKITSVTGIVAATREKLVRSQLAAPGGDLGADGARLKAINENSIVCYSSRTVENEAKEEQELKKAADPAECLLMNAAKLLEANAPEGETLNRRRLNDENDNVTELISISQIPSVIPTLDRRVSDPLMSLSQQLQSASHAHLPKNNSFLSLTSSITTGNLASQRQDNSSENNNSNDMVSSASNIVVNPTCSSGLFQASASAAGPAVGNNSNGNHTHASSNAHMLDRRTTSFRSDLSTNSSISGLSSTRSMLSEAKAKLEAFSGKFSRLNSSFNNGHSVAQAAALARAQAGQAAVEASRYSDANLEKLQVPSTWLYSPNSHAGAAASAHTAQPTTSGADAQQAPAGDHYYDENYYEDGEYMQTKF